MKNETIVDRVVERLKAQPLGDLITEEDLHDIVKEAIPKVFFEKRRVPDPRGYNNHTDLDPLMVEIMRDLLKESGRTLAKQWVTDNADLMFAHWRSVIDAGLLKYVQEMQNEIATSQVKSALFAIMKPINDERMRQGMPSIVF